MDIFLDSGVLVRIPFYICLGVVTEVLFTGMADFISPLFLKSWRLKNLEAREPELVKRDPRLMGYTFLWMLPIYAALILIEPIAFLLKDWPLFFRGFVYVPIFWFGEYVAGFVLKKITGSCPWDYSNSRFSLHGFMRWDFFPFWFAFTIFLDVFSEKLIELTPAIMAIF